ncbi:hypothetical protein, conserved [Eimeria praecox]|uniref:Trafficking protein particle complex subunit 11 domain-containing protein n=1 Tax=Eimeria praecox TaxID=51316 RepID=U6G7E7_9EIME|nr:hypothetical protein, conserved [Eimeria praecox]
MATIEFFRDRLQRRIVVPKIIVFVILPTGMEDPQSAVGFLKKLNPADIAAIFITCGVEDLKAKLEKLEQVSFDCSVEYYESEARRYRKQTQVTFKGDRSQTSAFHVYQTRCLIKAGYMLEFAQQPHAAMKSYITAWQFLTSYSQMAPALERMTVCNLISVRMYPMYFKAKEPSKAAHHAREHRAVLRENIPESPLQGYLLPLWLAQLHQLLAQLCEDAMRTSPSSLDTRDVWQLAGFHYQAAARYLQHVRAWIRTAKEVHPPPSMKGGLGVPSEWLGQPDTLQHGTGAFTTPSSQDPDAAAAAAQEEVFLRFIFFFNEAQVLTHATHLLSKAHIAFKLVGGYRSCPILACELADAMFDGHRLMTARQLYFTLATAFASCKYGHQKSWHLEAVPAVCSAAESGAPQHALDVECREQPRNEKAVSQRVTVDGDTGSPELFSAVHATTSARQSENFNQLVPDEPHLPPGSRLRFSGSTNCTGWWPLYRYVLARLTLCVSYLLSIPPADFLHKIARVDSRFSTAVGDSGRSLPVAENVEQPSLAASAAAPFDASAAAVTGGAQADAENCHIALKASFEIINILALREDIEDSDGSKRKQMHRYVETLLPLLRRFEQPYGTSPWIFHLDLHAVVVWTDFSSELHREQMVSDNDLFARHRVSVPRTGSESDSFSEGVKIGRVCFQHRLGFDISVLTFAELVTNTGKKAKCLLAASKDSPQTSAEEKVGHISLSHGALCYCDLYLSPQELRDVSGSTDSFKLDTVEAYPSKCICIGELAPYIVRLTIKQDWSECKFSIGLQCTAQESGGENDRTVDTSVLLEDEFESYLMELSDAKELDDDEGRTTNAGEQKETNGSMRLPTYPRLLRVPTNGSPCLPFTVKRDGSGLECTKERGGAGGRERVASPWVFDPREYRCQLSVAEWRALAGADAQDADEGLTSSEGVKVICVPMFIRLRRSGCFDVRVTVDINLDDIIQRLTTTSAVDCQRCLSLSSSLISFPSSGEGGPCEARQVNVTNVSGIALQLTDMCGAQVLLKYTRTADYLPFPFYCADLGIKENLTIARLPAVVKPLWLQCLHINLAHPVTSAVGVPFAFSAALENLTREAMELVVRLSYPQSESQNLEDSADLSSVTVCSDCPFMVGGQIKTQVIILPLSTKSLHWTLVASR